MLEAKEPMKRQFMAGDFRFAAGPAPGTIAAAVTIAVVAWFALAPAAAIVAAVVPSAQAARVAPARREWSAPERHGRYLFEIAGCNDCHTPGYAQTGGRVPEADWGTGGGLGWEGPWGTTYPANLRLLAQQLDEHAFSNIARSASLRPPMPWYALRAMSDSDVDAIYRFLRRLGPAGDPAPRYLPPGTPPRGAVVRFPSPPPSSRG